MESNGEDPQDVGPWPTLGKIRAMGEPERRRVLRWHVETGIDAGDGAGTITLRDDLDTELIEISRLELQAEAAAGELQNVYAERIRQAEALHVLAEQSPAFGQYLNAYLYFAVRFAVGRRDEDKEAKAHRDPRLNHLPLQLPIARRWSDRTPPRSISTCRSI